MKQMVLVAAWAAALAGAANAETVNICDRTPEVRDEVMRALELHSPQQCAAVDSAQMGACCYWTWRRRGYGPRG